MDQTEPIALLAWMQSGESETFKVQLPLLFLESSDTVIIDARFADFELVRHWQDEFPVDRNFARMFDQVEAAISRDEDPGTIFVNGVHERL